MKKWRLDTAATLGMSALAVAISTWYSIHTQDPAWIASSGAIVCVAGSRLSIRRLLRLGPSRMSEDETHLNGGVWGNSPEPEKATREETEKKRDWEMARVGFYLTVAGVVLWAYGEPILGAFL